MREALAVSAIVLVAALASAGPAPGAGAAASETGPGDLLRKAMASAGEPGWRGTVREFEAGVLVEREVTPEEFAERAAQAIRALESVAATPPSTAPGPVHAGAGSEDLDLPYPGCAPVTLFIAAEVPDVPEPRGIVVQGYGSDLPRALQIFERQCGYRTPSYQVSLLVDAASARATCSRCAVATAQVWADEAGPAAHVNDFRYAHVSGIGEYVNVQACFTGICIFAVLYGGNHAAIQLVDEVVPRR